MDDSQLKALAKVIVDGILDGVEKCGRFEGRKPKRRLMLSPILRGDDILPSSGVMEAWVQKKIAEAFSA